MYAAWRDGRTYPRVAANVSMPSASCSCSRAAAEASQAEQTNSKIGSSHFLASARRKLVACADDGNDGVVFTVEDVSVPAGSRALQAATTSSTTRTSATA
eukprot:GHVU01204570.1.p6 GENE.GHVU01204570.1~~GHVU01204570.1.p6  ORF type:complete len:100 (-),score=14.30 GHVU01204570.1:1315-1614(-)